MKCAAHDEEVHERVPAEKVHENRVKREDGEQVDAVPDSRFLGPDEARSEGVEEELERAAHGSAISQPAAGAAAS
jgi:hypothetical protein